MSSVVFPLLLLPFVFAIGVLLWVSSYAFQRRKQSKEAQSLFILSCGVILWMVGYVLGQISKGYQNQDFWYQWEDLGIILSSFMILVFSLRHAHRDHDIRKWHLVLTIPTTLMITLILLRMILGTKIDPWNASNPESSGLTGSLVLGYSFSICIAAVFILARAYFEAPASMRWQGVALIFAILLPMVISFQTDILGNVWISNFDVSTFSLVLTVLIFAWIIFRLQLLNF